VTLPARLRTSIAACLLPALIFAGCRQADERAVAPEDPVEGGTLVFAVDSLDHLNPAITSNNSLLRSTLPVYQGLMFLDEELNPQPELAESVTVEEGGKVYRVALREGVRWHDGRPFTSADVKFTFEEVLLEFHPRTSQVLQPKLEAIEIPDDETVVFRLKDTFGAFPLVLTVNEAPILPKHIFEGSDPTTNPANERPVGTGPFRFVSFNPESELRYERNPDYFREGLPHLNELVFRVISEPATQLIALERSDIDGVLDFEQPSPDLDRLGADPRFEVVASANESTSGGCTIFLAFNLDRPLFADPGVRLAIAHGIERQRMLDDVLFGYGRVADAPINSGIDWAHPDDIEYPGFDRQEAARLLENAGWVEGPDGLRVARGVPGVPDGTQFRFETISSTSRVKFSQVMADQLAEIGIEALATPLDSGLVDARVFEERDFDATMSGSCQRTDPEIGFRRFVHSSAIVPIENTNSAGYRNPELDSLMDQAASEPDRSERGDLYRSMQEILVRDLPYVWLVESDVISIRSTRCAGIQFASVHMVESAYCAR